MISLRLIALIVLGYILWQWGKKKYRAVLQYWQHKSAPPSPRTVTTVRCTYCGLHVPEQEAVHSNNIYFCCEAHKQAAFQQRKD
jgi:uncharacterized protein